MALGHVVLYPQPPTFWPPVAVLSALVWLVVRCCSHAKRGYCSGKIRLHRLTHLSLVALRGVMLFAVVSSLGVYRLAALLEQQLPHSLDKKVVSVSFRIEALSSVSDERAQLTAVVEAANSPLASKPANSSGAQPQKPYSLVGQRVRLGWYFPPALNVGQRWRADVVLRRPRGLINPSGFDYGAWLIGQGYMATGYIKKQPEAVYLGQLRPSPLQQLREHLVSALRVVQHEPAHRFFTALLLGDRQSLTADDWQVLQATGTVHLMAISGLHVGLVATLGFLLAKYAVRLACSLTRSSAAGWYRAAPPVTAMALSYGYAALAGFSVPTQRALIAVLLVNVAWMLGWRCSRWALLALALLCVSIVEPLVWLQTGFWLSFAAVAFLLALYDGQVGRERHPRRQARVRNALTIAVKMQCLLTLGLCVPLWLLGLPASVLSPLANVVAVPLVALFFVPLLLVWIPVSFTDFSGIFLQGLAQGFNALWYALQYLAMSPQAMVWASGSAEIWWLWVAVVASIMLILPASIAMRCGACLLVALLIFGQKKPKDRFELVALDVGQGLAVALNQAQGTFLYDTGAAFSERFNAGSHIIAPYLRARGVTPLSVMVSHADVDHRGGANALFERFSPREVWFGQPFDGLPAGAVQCIAGSQWQKGEARFRVLWPPANHLRQSLVPQVLRRTNNHSCVVMVEYRNKRFLLPGDIEADVERILLARAEAGVLDLGPVDVLIAPHHGSKTSSSSAFLALLKPAHVIVSAGYKSRYGHPHADVMARYQAIDAQVWQTGLHGAITVRVDGDQLQVIAERLRQPKPWY
ncbi:MAG TPA: DNA internalization-related competence protein ComEC/Rec2 [Marinagarivorans sp.]